MSKVFFLPDKNKLCMVIIMSSLFYVIFFFTLKVSGKERLNHKVSFPSTMMNKINKNSQIIETIFMMRFTEAAIIG